jgi:membrane associated rhomboid family serine protease
MISAVLVIVNLIVSYKGLKDYSFLQRYSLNVPQLLLTRDYKRIFTSGFLHASWTHFIFNMIALYSFGTIAEDAFGPGIFLTIYIVSLICGNLYAIIIHRNKPSYNAIGASGAVSGIIFACIALFPDMRMGLMFIPGISIPAWIFGLLYIAYTIFGIRAQHDNIGHDAHLSGGIAGMILAISVYPEALSFNTLPILVILVPSLIFIYLSATRPAFMLANNPFEKPEGFVTIEDRYNATKRLREKELDQLLDKISVHGMDSLSKKEKERLEELSKVK